MRKVGSVKAFLCFLMFVLCIYSVPAFATVVPYDMSVVWNGTLPPAGAAPWLAASFDDGDILGDVVLTITAGNLAVSEKIRGVYFNLDPSLTRADLIISSPTVVSGAFTAPSSMVASKDKDVALKADGDGYFDFKIEFEISDSAAVTFGSGDAVEYTISGIAGLSANSFNFMSFPGGGEGQYITVSHIQGIEDIEGTTSAWVTTPEPTTICLLGLGGLLLRRRKRA